MSLKYFSLDEFDCQVTGENRMDPDFLEQLDALRLACGFTFIISSGYRHPTLHPIEAAKKVPGTHAQGIAADVVVKNANQRYCIVQEATKLGFRGIGVAKDFVHVDMRSTDTHVLWLY